MKIIFLDIDGVLNHIETREYAPSGAPGVEDEGLAAIKFLVDASDAKIVLTSTWREGSYEIASKNDKIDFIYLKKKLSEHGLSIYDITADHPRGSFHRGLEILDWIEKHPGVEEFLILDDYWFDFKDCGLTDHLFLVEESLEDLFTYDEMKTTGLKILKGI